MIKMEENSAQALTSKTTVEIKNEPNAEKSQELADVAAFGTESETKRETGVLSDNSLSKWSNENNRFDVKLEIAKDSGLEDAPDVGVKEEIEDDSDAESVLAAEIWDQEEGQGSSDVESHWTESSNESLSCKVRAKSKRDSTKDALPLTGSKVERDHYMVFPKAESLATYDKTTSFMSDLCKDLPETDNAQRSMCIYECLVCAKKSNTWIHFQKHVLKHHKQVVTKNDIKKYLFLGIAHKCRVCSVKILCDNSILSRHVKSHKITFTSYCSALAKCNKLNDSSIMDFLPMDSIPKPDQLRDPNKRTRALHTHTAWAMEQVCKGLPLSDDITKSQCVFRCHHCRKTVKTFAILARHLQSCHKERASYQYLPRYLMSGVAHKCRICSKKILCDYVLLTNHVIKIHHRPFKQYVSALSQVSKSDGKAITDFLPSLPKKEPKPKLRKKSLKETPLQKLIKQLCVDAPVTDSVYAGCVYQCQNCDYRTSNWMTFKIHFAKSGHGEGNCPSVNLPKYLVKTLAHRCQICGDKTLCDTKFIKNHVLLRHDIDSLAEYRSSIKS